MIPGAQGLFEPLRIGSAQLANRIVMAPMTRNFSPGGVPGPDVAAYYRRRAEGGAGLIVTEGVGVDHPAAIDHDTTPVMYGEAALAGWRRVTDEVHAAGGVIFPQLWHQGPRKAPGVGRFAHVAGQSPSGVWGPQDRHTSLDQAHIAEMARPTRPMTETEIADVVAGFARAARNAAEAGFDGIAIHGAHGYLIDCFFWDETNLRTDRYGGARRARSTFGAEVVRAIRAAVPDLPIMFRFSQWKMQDYDARLATGPAELEEILGPLADAGVDVFDASTRHFYKPEFEGSELNLAGWAKTLTGKLAMTVGGVGLNANLYDMLRGAQTSLDAGNLALLTARFGRGEFDLVGVGRSILADPHWPTRLKTGEPFREFDRSALTRLA